MAWTFYLLATHPEAAERVRAEEERVLAKRALTPADFPKLEYTLRVVEEANRLYPQGWIVGREAAADDEIDGFSIPRGSAMFPSAWLAHRDPEWWGPEPTRFDPDHFAPERAKARPRYAYFPFGAGQRLCIGNNLAILETVVAVVAVLRRFRLELPDGFVPQPRARFALDLDGGLPARVVHR
jgi:cytochrome P450